MSGDYFRDGFQALPANFTFFSRVGRLKKIIIIAGLNGAGKTTFARDFLPSEAHTLRFINADLIAAGLAPFNPESVAFKAGRLMLQEIDECVAAGHDFAFETTLSGLSYLQKIKRWQALGYQVKLWFLSLPNDDLAVARVAQRVMQGGHNIPEDVIRRRFKAGLENFHKNYSKVVDSWALYDSYVHPPKLIDWSK
jgi:predicted ABC-type ATPase